MDMAKIEMKHEGEWVKVWEGPARGRNRDKLMSTEVGVYMDNIDSTDEVDVLLDAVTGELYKITK
jgi:hypothetical protein